MRQHVLEYVLFQARGNAIGNVAQQLTVEHVNSAVYQAWLVRSRFFAKRCDSQLVVHLKSPVTRCIRNASRRHADHSAMRPMKTQQLWEIDFEKGVAVHDHKFRSASEIPFGEFDRASSAERTRLARIINDHIHRAAIAEFLLYLSGQVTGTHDQVAETL